MAKLKVFGGLMMGSRRQVRVIVAASSQSKVASLVGETLGTIRGYWVESGNDRELALALANPGQVFRARDSCSGNYKPVVLVDRVLVDDHKFVCADIPPAHPEKPSFAVAMSPGALPDDAWILAEKVRVDLDRQSCPGVYMDLAVESIVKHFFRR